MSIPTRTGAGVHVRDRDTEPDALPDPADSDPTLDETAFAPLKSGLMPRVTRAELAAPPAADTTPALSQDEVIAAMRELYADGEADTALLLASIVRDRSG